jgi:hypothetical protein
LIVNKTKGEGSCNGREINIHSAYLPYIAFFSFYFFRK